VKTKTLGRRYAACRRHAALALDHMIGRPVLVRNADPDPHKMSCSCGNRARFLLIELDDPDQEA
jgi:hypothetical protein